MEYATFVYYYFLPSDKTVLCCLNNDSKYDSFDIPQQAQNQSSNNDDSDDMFVDIDDKK